MAVAAASVGGGMTEPPTQQMDALRSESVADVPSSSISAGNGLDRSGSSNSSPNHPKDAEIEPPDLSKSEEYRQLFRLPQEEVLIEDFNCALQENILIQGHMYLFINFICFYSNIFGFETKRIIPFHEVTGVRRAKTAGLFPNAIEILAGSRKYFFGSFLSRDEAFNIINDGWVQHGNSARAINEQQESISESGSQENGFIAIEKANSSEILDSELPATNLSKDNSCGDTVSKTNPEQQSSFNQGAEPGPNSSDSRITWNWNEAIIDAPKVPEDFTNVAESKFPIKVEDFLRYFFSDDAVNFLESFHKRCGDKDLKCTSWNCQEEFGYAREKSFQHPIKLYLGAKFGGCHEVQTLRIYKDSHLVLKTSQEVSDVPYADYFRVEGLWDVQRDDNESECCILRVYVNVAFSKRTIFKGKIVQSTIEECREAYASWINMAHELMKQKKLEKQEDTTNVTQTEEVNLDSERKSVESSERSQESSNPTTVQATSTIIDPSHNVGNRLQGNLIDSTSVSYMLRECATKFRSCLKSQSHLSLLLVIIFAVIFFMQQFSILVLLSRPQHIHVSTPTDFMYNRIENGVARSPSEIAWLEKRIHYLKDEMHMVETRLERMRYEHALLKKQLRDLELAPR